MDSTAFSHKLSIPNFSLWSWGLTLSREMSTNLTPASTYLSIFSRLNPLPVKQGYIPTSSACLMNVESTSPINVMCATPKSANLSISSCICSKDSSLSVKSH